MGWEGVPALHQPLQPKVLPGSALPATPVAAALIFGVVMVFK